MDVLSNQLFMVALLGYVAAMALYAAEAAFGSHGVVARVVSRELVGAAGPPVHITEPEPGPEPERQSEPGSPIGARPEGRARFAGDAAVAVNAAAVGAHTGVLIARGLAAGRVPWGNMYEYVLAISLVGAFAWVAVAVVRPRLRPIGLFVTLTLVVMLAGAGLRLYTAAGPLVPALNSYWLKIHVTAAATSAGILLVGFVAATLTLLRTGFEHGRRGTFYNVTARLPGAATLEQLTFRLHAFAFPLWTFAIVCGAIWAEAAWGRYWGWDPKETWSFVTWVIYACYLHARATPSVKPATATWLAVAGWTAMLVNLYGVNLVIAGLHSYAGVK